MKIFLHLCSNVILIGLAVVFYGDKIAEMSLILKISVFFMLSFYSNGFASILYKAEFN